MKNYDPNICEGIHTIRVTFQQWEYTGHIAFTCGENCHGAIMLDANFLDYDSQDDIDRYAENDCDLKYDEDDDYIPRNLRTRLAKRFRLMDPQMI